MEGIGGLIRRRAVKPGGPSKPAQLPGIDGGEKAPREKYMHSPEHVLAAEMSAYFSERQKFALYLGVIKRLGVAQARAIFSSIKSGETDVQNPRKFFMWLSKANRAETAAPKPKKPAAAKRAPKKIQLDIDDFLR